MWFRLMDSYIVVALFVVAVQLDCLYPNPLNEVTTNLNADDSQKACACGKKKPGTRKRILGGKDADVNEYPWAVFIKLGQNGQYCGGSVINSKWILTAAHCIKAEPDIANIVITLGEHDLTSQTETELEKDFEAEEIVIFPDEEELFYVDLALIKVKGTIDLSIYTPICLPKTDFDIRGDRITLTGWGIIKCDPDKDGDCGNIKANILQELDMPTASNAVCKDAYNKLETFKFVKVDPRQKNIFCFGGEKGRNSCQGDSGSGVIYNQNGRYTLVGALSANTYHPDADCGVEGQYGYSYEVAKYRQWIDKTATGGKYCQN